MGLFPLLGPQQPGNGVAGTDAEEEGNGLDNGHAGKGNPYRCGGTGINLTDKVRISRIVKAGTKHTDDGRKGQGSNELCVPAFSSILWSFAFSFSLRVELSVEIPPHIYIV